MSFDEPEETELIDVSAVSDLLPDESSLTPAQLEPSARTPLAGQSPPLAASIARPTVLVGTRVATTGERFAAWWLDTLLFWGLYWGSVTLYNKIFTSQWQLVAPVTGVRGLLFHGIFVGIILLYYLIFEGVFFATPGKLLCRMAIRRKDGAEASYTAILIRNLLRPLDLLLLGVMALVTQYRQHLGDFVAGTIVTKRQTAHPASPIPASTLAGPVSRSIAAFVDVLILGAFAGGLLLLLNPTRPLLSQWLVVGYPVILIVGITLFLFATETSPGKWLLGFVVVQENGTRIGMSHALLRTLFLPFDGLLLLGPLSITLSPRHQRIGDAIAGTLVIRRSRDWIGGIVGMLALLCVAGIGYAGWMNPVSWLRTTNFSWQFLPKLDAFPNWPNATPPPAPFTLKNFRFAAGSPDAKRTPPVFLPGETAYFLFEIDGYKKNENHVWVQQDLVVRYPDQSFGLRQENIIDYKQLVRAKGPIELINNVNLPLTAMPGKYTVYITVRDRLSEQQVMSQEAFEVKGDSPPPETPAQADEIHRDLAPSATPMAAPTLPTTPMATPAAPLTSPPAPTVMAAPMLPSSPLPAAAEATTTTPMVMPGPTPVTPPPSTPPSSATEPLMAPPPPAVTEPYSPPPLSTPTPAVPSPPSSPPPAAVTPPPSVVPPPPAAKPKAMTHATTPAPSAKSTAPSTQPNAVITTPALPPQGSTTTPPAPAPMSRPSPRDVQYK